MKGFLRLRGNTYYFRCRVPLDLQGRFFSGREIQKSLHTTERKQAKEAAAEWYCLVSRVFHLCRLNSLPESQLHALVQAELFPTNKKQQGQSVSPLLRDTFDSYVKEHKVNWREKSFDEVTYSLDLAVEVIGNLPVSQLSPDVIKSYLATILKLPANHKKKPDLRNMRVSDIVQLEGLPPMSHKSVCNICNGSVLR